MTPRGSAGRPARCEVIAIGTEMTAGPRVDTNSVWLRRQLAELALDVTRVTVVGDDPENLRDIFRESAARADLVIATGGLGPTDDDRTVEALAASFGRALERHDATHRHLRRRAEEQGRQLRPEVERMARVPAGAMVLPNPRGAAPGLLLEVDATWVIALPGVPDEMRGLFAADLGDRLASRHGRRETDRRTLRVGGVWESDADARAMPICRARGVSLTTLASDGTVELHVEGALPAVEATRIALAGDFGADLVSDDGRSLEEVVIDAARGEAGTIGVAESCTGGRVAARLTSVPGASDVFTHGYVTYADQAKVDLLGVPQQTLREFGAVSEETVRAMLDGLFGHAGCRWGVAVSGIAGPGGGSADKPVGTVWFAAGAAGSVRCVRTRLTGGRQRIQAVAAGVALDRLRRAIAIAGAGK